MSTRRQARARPDYADGMSTDGGRPPRALLIGRCVDVWAAKGGRDQFSALRRFDAARAHWLAAAGVDNTADKQALMPNGAPWTVEYLLYHGHAERLGRRPDVLASE